MRILFKEFFRREDTWANQINLLLLLFIERLTNESEITRSIGGT